MDVAKLIQYTHAARRGYLKALGELPWEEVVKDRGASYSSLRDIFLHALDAEDLFINYLIPGKSSTMSYLGKVVSPDYGEFTDMVRIGQRVDEVERQVDTYLAALTERELDRKAPIPWRKEPPEVLRVEDVLVFVVIEDASHMGELIALMWQLDKQPPYLGWHMFLRGMIQPR